MRLLAIFSISFALATADARATSPAELCGQDIEGTYVATPTPGETVRVNIFCLDAEHPVGSIAGGGVVGGERYTINWAFFGDSAMDGEDLILSNFQIAPDARGSGSSKSTASYLRINPKSLAAGTLDATYTGKLVPGFVPLHAARAQAYPRVSGALTHPLAAAAARGVFAIQDGPFAGGRIVFDVLAGTPVVTLLDSARATSIHLTQGATWNNDGLISIATAEGNGGEADDFVFYYLRGSFLTPDLMEFYLVIPALGLNGPFRAIRIK